MLCKIVVWFCVGTCECFCRGRLLLLMSCPSHNVLPLAGACLCPLCYCGEVVSRKASSSRWQEEVGHRLWLPAVAIHRLGIVEITPSPHHSFRTAHSCAQSVKHSPTEPVLSGSSLQRLGHLQSHVDGGWHVCQAVFPEPQSAAAHRRVERRDCAHEVLPPLQSASSWSMMEQLVVSGVCRLRSMRQATVLLM